ncbi:MAG TPA: FecR domain-containing protein, partial [Thermoanaerobaculia bacterium]|nr:FecR domain-containing protein [Thermoanaerobaculia bacterium]
MSRTPKIDAAALDQLIAQARSETPDPATVEAAAARVWERLASGSASAAAPAPGPTAAAAYAASAPGCAEFTSVIPAYLAGTLAPARALLLEDHTRECLACRRALKEARAAQSAPGSAAAAADLSAAGWSARRPAAARRAETALRRRPLALALAAMLALVAGAGLVTLLGELLTGGAQMARVASVQGDLFRLDGAGVAPVAAGDAVGEGDELRTAKGSTAVLRMADGSLIEINERAGLALDGGLSGNTIELARGQVIVQAAKQRPRRLFVESGDAVVSVTGTIFSVNHGTKGSRVSVVEGEVRVAQARRESVLHAGDQIATHESVEHVALADELSWSRDRERYLALLGELGELGRDIDARLDWPGLRTSTRLLDLAPAGTRIWVALPNLAENLAETQRSLDSRIAESDVLRQWWEQTMRSDETERRFREVLGRFEALGRHLGPEVAVAVTDAGPVALAEVTNPAALRAAIEDEMSRAGTAGGHEHHLTIVDDPAAAAAGQMSVWIGDDVLVAAPEPALLAAVAAAAAGNGQGGFAGTPFHGRLAEAYAEGAGWLFGADAKKLIATHGPHSVHGGEAAAEGEADGPRHAEALGILDLEHFVVDHRETAAGGQTLAAISFDRPRRGVASWLAAPGPMGSLGFVSPEATIAAAFVVKDPTAMLDDLLAAVPEMGEALAKLRSEHGLDLREDLAAPLGGEVAFAVDGPLLPKPSWKLILEVYDPARLQATLKRFAAEVAQRDGHPAVTLTEDEAGGRTWYTLRCAGGAEGEEAFEVHYTFADGFLLAGPSRALLER